MAKTRINTSYETFIANAKTSKGVETRNVTLAITLKAEDKTLVDKREDTVVTKSGYEHRRITLYNKVREITLSFGLAVQNPADGFSSIAGTTIASGRSLKTKSSLLTLVSYKPIPRDVIEAIVSTIQTSVENNLEKYVTL